MDIDIPSQLWSKIGVYEFQINGVDVKATIVNQMDHLEKGLSELRSRIGDLPLVGVDFKNSISALGFRPDLILMYVKDRCLIIQLSYFTTFPEIIGHFLSDKSLCFLGFGIDSHFKALKRYSLQFTYTKPPAARNCLTGNGTEIGKLAALILKNSSLQNCCSLVELASKIGFHMKEAGQKIEPAGWKAFVFSDEEIKYAINDVSSCYNIGKKLFGML